MTSELLRDYFAILDALHSWRLSSHISDTDDVVLCGFLSRLRTAFNALCETQEKTVDDAEARAVRCEGDGARLDWLQSEHDRVDPVAALVVKQLYQRDSNQWANVAGNVREAIDKAMA